MYWRGNYGIDYGQNVRPPYQQQIPAPFPPGTSTAPPSAENQAPHVPSQGGYSFPPLYNLPLAPPSSAPHAQTLQAPTFAMSRTVTSGQSHVSAPLLPGPPPIPLSMPMSSSQFNAQRNPYPHLLAGNHNAPHVLTSQPPPPLARPSMSFSQTALPLRPGMPSFWPMVNQQPNNPQGALPSPSLDPSVACSSGSAVILVPEGTSSSNAASQPFPSSLPPPPPIPPHPSSVSSFSSAKLQQHFETEQKSERSLNSVTRSSESSDNMLNPSKPRIDAPLSSGGHIEEEQRNCMLGNQVTNGSILNSPPPKPLDENMVQNIELLCQYIAKNGPGFEDTIRRGQEGNPKFLFLFDDVPGSKAAIAHNYFQWLKKKYCSTEKLPDGLRQTERRHAETSSPVKPENVVLDSLSDEQLDSDMEMEDDITHFNEDERISKSAANLSCSSDSILMKKDVLEELQVLQDRLVCVSPTDVATRAFPSTVVSLDQEKGSNSLYTEDQRKPMNRTNEVHSGTDSPGYAELPLDGIVLNFPSGQENDVCSSPGEKYDLDNKLGHIVKSGSPFRLLQDYASDDSSETDQKAFLPQSLTVDAAGPVNAILSKIEKATEPLGEPNNQLTGLSNSRERGNVNTETFTTSFVQGVADKGNDENNDKPESVPTISSPEHFQQEGSSRSQSDNIHKDEKFVKETDVKEIDSGTVTVKVDEFGRLLKKGGSDSDSDFDDSRCARRYDKRGRYRSRSPSPRSRRRSIHCSKREKRSRSPSWSPRRRRSRSRSPFRRGREFGGLSTRRGSTQIAKCFDFSRGRCHRGASCRYLHQDSEFEGSRHRRRNMQSSQISSSPTRSQVEEMKSVPERAVDEAQGQSTPLSLKMANESFTVASDKVGENPIRDLSPDAVFGEEIEDCPTAASDIGLVTKIAETHQIQSVFDSQKTQNETTGHLTAKKSLGDSFQVNADAAVAVGANHLAQQTNSSTFPKSLDREFTPTQEAPKILQLPQPPLLPLPPRREPDSQGLLPIPRNDFATSVASSGSGRNYMLPNPQLPYFAPPLQAPWNSLSTSQPLPYVQYDSHVKGGPHVQYDSHVKGGLAPESAVTSGYAQNGQSCVAHGTELDPQALHKPYPIEAPLFHASQFQHQAYAAQQEAYPHYVSHSGNPYLARESVQQLHSGSSHLNELPKSSQPYPYYPSTGFQYSGESIGRDVSRNMDTSAYGLDLMHGGQTSFPPDSRYRNHCNPYASSLEQPHVAKFCSGSENVHEVLGTDVPADRQAAAGVGAMQTNLPVESARLPLPGGGQYDPLFDSSESKSLKRVNDWEHFHAHDATGIIDSNKPLDIEENNRRKDIGTFIPSLSQEDDGFGETADAEVGIVENASPSQSFAIGETDDFADEVETSQVKSPGKRKKNKDSRSGHLFKNAIAKFVKEVLRPSWRQGNMSKEAFKTIVKKTVDKVAGAMKSHRIPKSQVKIDQYIDSSQRKLTKLVMGYVDKYVNA